MYTAAHPDLLMGKSNVGSEGNVFIEEEQEIDADTPLLPFRKRSGGFWTTKDSWDHTVLGYTYPELQKWRHDSEQEYRASVIASISRLYGGSSRSQLTSKNAGVGGSNIGMLANDVIFTEWTIETQASVSGLPPTFVVRFSLVDKSSSGAGVDAGTWMILKPSDHQQRRRTTTISEQQSLNGTLSLTAHLLDEVAAGRLASLEADAVVPFLKDRLMWKVHSVCSS